MGYSTKAIKGIGWVGALQVFSKLLGLLKYIIIARFLLPTELGLFGIVLLTTNFLDSFTEIGPSAFLVQLDKDHNKYISSVWLFTILRGFILFVAILLLAYPISIFFNVNSAFPLLVATSLFPLIRGFINPSFAKFQKNLEFNREFLYRFSISLFDFAVTSMFIIYYSVAMSLIIGLIISTVFEVILSFLVIKPRPKLEYDIKRIKEIFSFGKWLTVITAMNYLARQMDSIAVGKYLGIESLGIYQLSQKFSLQILSDAGDVFSRVTFPLFSKIKNDVNRTKKAFIKILIVCSLVFGLITVFLIIFSKDLLVFSAGMKWISADIPMKIFSIIGLVTAFMAVITSLFLAHNQQDITARIVFIRILVIGIIIVPITIHFGLIGTSFVSLLSYVIAIPVAIFGINKILRIF